MATAKKKRNGTAASRNITDPVRAVRSMDKLLGRRRAPTLWISDFLLYCKLVADACKRYLGVIYSDLVICCKATDPLVQKACQAATKLALSKRLTLCTYIQRVIVTIRLLGYPQGDHRRDPFIAVGSKCLSERLDVAHVLEEKYIPSMVRTESSSFDAKSNNVIHNSEIAPILESAVDTQKHLDVLPHSTAESQWAWLLARRATIHPVTLYACDAVHNLWSSSPSTFHPQTTFYAAKYSHSTFIPTLREIVAWRAWEAYCSQLCDDLHMLGVLSHG